MTTVTSSELLELSAGETAAAVVAGTSPVEIAEAVLAQIGSYDPVLRLWSQMDVDDVRAQAAVLAEEAAAGRFRGPLHGVPVGFKEQFAVKGFGTQQNASRPPGPPASEDSTVVARLREAGALVLGKLYMVGPLGTPPSRNPWNPAHTPGGSSSGSGAAVASRMAPLALGEQTAGSNNRPAAFCGVAGYKGTYGIIPRAGMFPLVWSTDHPGLMARTVEDLALMLSVLAGPDPRDPTSLPATALPADLYLSSVRPPRIGLVRNLFPERTGAEMQAAVEAAAVKFADAGAEVIDYVLPEEFDLLWHGHVLVSAGEKSTLNAHKDPLDVAPHPTAVGGARREVLSLLPATYYLQAQRLRRHLRGVYSALFADVDLLLTGAAPGPAPEGLASSGNPVLQVPSSYLGSPATTINAGLSQNGLPLGVQFMGAPMADYEVLQWTAWCEGVLGRLPAPAMDWA
jgi:aspartyl-tRNA(Asn)/glutamyl-tRNA(Gln) amidotransferase subunit A